MHPKGNSEYRQMNLKRKKDVICCYRFSIPLFLIFYYLSAGISQAGDFNAFTIDYRYDITVMEVTGNYDARGMNGSENRQSRMAVGKAFYQNRPDDHDFLVVVTDFDFKMCEAEARACYHGVKNDIQGIGIPIFDHSLLYGSSGRLQGIIDLGNIENIVSDPMDSQFTWTMTILSHELLHRWAAYIQFEDKNGAISNDLLGLQGTHWSYLFDTGGSLLYGNQWKKNPDGTFTSLPGFRYYSSLDLYLMGLIGKSEVLPMRLIVNNAIDPNQLPATGVTISGKERYVTIDNIISAVGERIPDVESSPKRFNIGCIFMTRPGTFEDSNLQKIKTIMKHWPAWFSSLTDGRGIIRIESGLSTDLPQNPGMVQPQVDIRDTPPDVMDGIAWLMDRQNPDGSWSDSDLTAERDTAAAVAALSMFIGAEERVTRGRVWLADAAGENVDYLARHIMSFPAADDCAKTAARKLISMQHSSGAWGSGRYYLSNPKDTALAICGLAYTGLGTRDMISDAINYLKQHQQPDGAWGFPESNIRTTVHVLDAFFHYLNDMQLQSYCHEGFFWLTSMRNADGGFGNGQSTVIDTAVVLSLLKKYNISEEKTHAAVDFLQRHQNRDGSWNQSTYQTGLAVNAIWKATRLPDPGIDTQGISFTPQRFNRLPSDIRIEAVVYNSGYADVSDITVSLYINRMHPDDKIGEQTVSIPGNSSITTSFEARIDDAGSHPFIVVIDESDLVKESCESNNHAVKTCYPDPSFELTIPSSGVSMVPVPAKQLEPVVFTASVYNEGTVDACNVPVKFSIIGEGKPVEIAQINIDIPAGGHIKQDISWLPTISGENLKLIIAVDPENLISEINELNNQHQMSIDIIPCLKPDLSVSGKDISIVPDPGLRGQKVTISVPVKNTGNAQAENVIVQFCLGESGKLSGSKQIELMEPGAVFDVFYTFENLPDPGKQAVSVHLDPENRIEEVRENDNIALTHLDVADFPDLTISGHGIAFDPPLPRSGDILTIGATIWNLGDQPASHVTVDVYENQVRIDSAVIDHIDGNSNHVLSFAYDTSGKTGARDISAVVDADNRIVEQNEFNNRASRGFGVQNADLWLSQRYISPDGDGRQDIAHLFFRFKDSKTVKIHILDPDGIPIKVFQGDIYDKTTGGLVQWDGLDDKNMAVPDGTYQFRITDDRGNILADLPVIVDTNRSTLFEAVENGNIAHRNLTCAMPDISHWQWIADESGIIVSSLKPDSDTPEYPTGVYRLDPSGTAPLRIVPELWQKPYQILNDTVYYTYQGNGFSLSKDKNKAAVVIDRFDGSLTLKHELSQLWSFGLFGENPESKASFEIPVDRKSMTGLPVWSDDGSLLACVIEKTESGLQTIAIINASEDQRWEVSPARAEAILHIEWSPDSRRIAYVQGKTVIIADCSGSLQQTYPCETDHIHYLKWLNNDQIIQAENGAIRLIDASGSGSHITVAEKAYAFDPLFGQIEDLIAVHPDRTSFACMNTGNHPQWSVLVCNATGECSQIHENPGVSPDSVNEFEWQVSCLCDMCYQFEWECMEYGENCEFVSDYCASGFSCNVMNWHDWAQYYPPVYQMQWSSDGSMLSFVDNRYFFSTCDVDGTLIPYCERSTNVLVYDIIGNKIIRSQEVDMESWDGLDYDQKKAPFLNWFSDGRFIIAGDRIVKVHQPETVELDLPGITTGLSPHDRYILWENRPGSNDICYGKGNTDLWLTRSLMNLTAELTVMKTKSDIILKGTASDINFDRYELEYAAIDQPDQWHPIAPPSETPVIDDVMARWVPPAKGTYLLKLEVYDRAGNVASTRQRLFWNQRSSIGDIQLPEPVFSPDGDGVGDNLLIYYRVNEPVGFQVLIVDETGQPVRTLEKNHLTPGKGLVSWDGRDDSGKIVADGTYSARMLDHTLNLIVDNTLPCADIDISAIDIAGEPGSDTWHFEAILSGVARDKNLKRWVVSYSNDKQPDLWHEYVTGNHLLFEKGENGSPVPQKIDSFSNSLLEFAVGKKFRIRVEDQAGNIATAMAPPLEEVFVFYSWDFKRLRIKKSTSFETDNDIIAPENTNPGIHYAGGLETIETPFTQMNVQYRVENDWKNGPKENHPVSGFFDLEWDSSHFDMERINAVRIKASDTSGQIYYSNSVPLKLLDLVINCKDHHAENYAQGLTSLKIQRRGVSDNQWQDMVVYSNTDGNFIPLGKFMPEFPDDLKNNGSWELRMLGTARDGSEISSDIEFYPAAHCPWINAYVSYRQDTCDRDYRQAIIVAELHHPPSHGIALTYYIKDQDQFLPVKTIDLTELSWENHTIDTNGLAPGEYDIRIVFDYRENGLNKQIEASTLLIVDHVPPVADMVYPAADQVVCPTARDGKDGVWYGIDIDGVVDDEQQIQMWELLYGIGNHPAKWHPALSRSHDQPCFQKQQAPEYGLIRVPCETDAPHPILGNSPVNGLIGVWSIDTETDDLISLQLRATDMTGNVTCTVIPIRMDQPAPLTLSAEPRWLSPNGDGRFDNVNITFTSPKAVQISAWIENKSGIIRTLVNDFYHSGGTGSLMWDGTDDSGAWLCDGFYTVKIRAVDPCGNIVENRISDIEIDRTSPEAFIFTPSAGKIDKRIIEIHGTAQDKNLVDYRLEAINENDPSNVIQIFHGNHGVMSGAMGIWDASGIQGKWILRLTAYDRVGNISECAIPIALTSQSVLIKKLQPAFTVFSPNRDGRRDQLNIHYELTETCNLTFEILNAEGVLQKAVSLFEIQPGSSTFIWDGSDMNGKTVKDGKYVVRITACLSSDNTLKQVETLTISSDITEPEIMLSAPFDQPFRESFLKGTELIKGSITDDHPDEYTIACVNGNQIIPIDSGRQYRQEHVFGTLETLPEGVHTLRIHAIDMAGNSVEQTIPFVIDRTPPVVILTSPEDHRVFGENTTQIDVRCSVNEDHIFEYVLKYSHGEPADNWIELKRGQTISSGILTTWQTGIDSLPDDGHYTLVLTVTDRSGWETAAQSHVVIDRSAPQIAVSSPSPDSCLTSKNGLVITGTIEDANLKTYEIELAPGNCDAAALWTPLVKGNKPVSEGLIGKTILPLKDGIHCIRLTAWDTCDNQAVKKQSFTVDTQPPDPPYLSGHLTKENKVYLDWEPGPDTDITGFMLYRNGLEMNSQPIAETTYLDGVTGEGAYSYIVKAVDIAGWTSAASNEVKLRIDLTAPDAKITFPSNGDIRSSFIEIKGTAFSRDDFSAYRVFAGQGDSAENQSLLKMSSLPIPYGVLAQWDSSTVADGVYSIKLETEDLSGNTRVDQVVFNLDNTAPEPPENLEAIPVETDHTDIRLTWKLSTGSDVSGYLVYRNGSPVNGQSTYTMDPTLFLIDGHTHTDSDLPDGTYTYEVIAVDKAGNMSLPATSATVNVNRHPPAAVITKPENGHRFDRSITIEAESSDADIAHVQFQYRKIDHVSWTNLNDPFTARPFIVTMIPQTLGLEHGEYDIRAVAVDTGGKTDPSPDTIRVSYADLTAPETPMDIDAKAFGGKINIQWKANSENDLAGYRIRVSSEDGHLKKTSDIIKSTGCTYPPSAEDLPDGRYNCTVTALDTGGNESEPSEKAHAVVFTTGIDPPYTPVQTDEIQVSGITEPSARVIVTNTDDQGTARTFTANTCALGRYELTIALSEGMNTLKAVATDMESNVGKVSSAVVVIKGTPPEAPSGLSATPVDHSVFLNWEANPEPDILGYFILRDGLDIISPRLAQWGMPDASYISDSNVPELAIDGDSNTFWKTPLSHGAFTESWWQLNLDDLRLVADIEIEWGKDGNQITHSAGNFKVQVWTGFAWLTMDQMENNTKDMNQFTFSPPYPTDRIRIHITDASPSFHLRQVFIAEVRTCIERPIEWEEFEDKNLSDGKYSYQVQAVDRHGFRSPACSAVSAEIGDIIAPAAPSMPEATVRGNDVHLNWLANTETDIAGYRVYRKCDNEWELLDMTLPEALKYIDKARINGDCLYHVTAVDLAGNESAPSDNVHVTISTPLPPAPENVRIKPDPKGNRLEICWDPVSESVDGYDIYRSLSAGGPYEKRNAMTITTSCYLDTNLPNGVQHYYVVVSRDHAGNKSPYSLQASAAAADSITPLAPVFFNPVPIDTEIKASRKVMDIYGWSEPGARIRLFRDHIRVGETVSRADDHLSMDILPKYTTSQCLSPTGAYIAYLRNNGALWILNLDTGVAERIGTDARHPCWSPRKDRLACVSKIDDTMERIFLYDTATGQSTVLTPDLTGSESQPSWSAEGASLVYLVHQGDTDEVWIFDIDKGKTRQIMSGTGIETPAVSRGNAFFAFKKNGDLYLFDPLKNETRSMAKAVTQFSWSPTGKALGYIRIRNGIKEFNWWDTENESFHSFSSSKPVCGFAWSPCGHQVVLMETMGNKIQLVIRNVADPSILENSIHASDGQIELIGWLATGEIAYQIEQTLYRFRPAGLFQFKAVELSMGNQGFHAIAEDASGNQSPASDTLNVFLSSRLLPNLEISMDSILLFPDTPLVEEKATFDILIRNTGTEKAEKFNVELIITDASGQIAADETLAVNELEGKSETHIFFHMEPMMTSGKKCATIIIDPRNNIDESSETDNRAVFDFYIRSGNDDVDLNPAIDYDWYGPNEDMTIHITIFNHGGEKDITLNIEVTDSQGKTVDVIDSIQATIFPELTGFDVKWNTGMTAPGEYTLKTVLVRDSTVLKQSTLVFTIAGDIQVDCRVSTDQRSYGPDQDIPIRVTIENTGRSTLIPDLTVRMTVTDNAGQQLYQDEIPVSNLIVGTPAALAFRWNTAGHQPGTYHVVCETLIDQAAAASDISKFDIVAVKAVTGTIQAVPEIVHPGTDVQAVFRLTSVGNVAFDNLIVRVLLCDTATSSVIQTREQVMSIGIGESIDGTFLFHPPASLSTCKLILQYESAARSDGDSRILAVDFFRIKDVRSPLLTIVSPENGDRCGNVCDLNVIAADDAAGIKTVEYAVAFHGISENDPEWVMTDVWKPLMPDGASESGYTATWYPGKSEEGKATLTFRAADHAGNMSSPVHADIHVSIPDISQDLFIDPPLSPTIDTVIKIHGKSSQIDQEIHIQVDTGSGFCFAATTVSDSSGFFSGDVILQPGKNHIRACITNDQNETVSVSNTVTVACGMLPSRPTGLTGSVRDDTATLSWHSGNDFKIAGYLLFQNDRIINTTSAPKPSMVTASSHLPGFDADLAADNNPDTQWRLCRQTDPLPAWMEIRFAQPIFISQVNVNWGDPGGKYAARDYEIQAGYANNWITRMRIDGNTDGISVHRFDPLIRTDRIRINILSAADEQDCIHIAELGLRCLNLITESNYADPHLPDGTYRYKVSAIDYSGFESETSEPIVLSVNQKTNPDPDGKPALPPPAPDNVTGKQIGTYILIEWSAGTAAQLYGYHVYRNSGQGLQRLTSSPLIETRFQDKNPETGIHEYCVTAVDMNGNESVPSAAISIYMDGTSADTDDAVCQMVQFFADVANNGVRLAWLPCSSSNIAGYNIYRSPDYIDTPINFLPFTQVSWIDSQISSQTHTYWICAVDAQGNQGPASARIVIETGNTVPQITDSLIATGLPEGDAVHLTWQCASDQIIGFYIYRSCEKDTGFQRVTPSMITENHFVDQTVKNQTVYFYKITGIDRLGNEYPVTLQAAVTPADIIPPSKPIWNLAACLNPVETGNIIRLSGWTEPGTTIALYQNGHHLTSQDTEITDTIEMIDIRMDSRVESVSFSADQIAWIDPADAINCLYIRDFGEGTQTMISKGCSHPKWSPCGSQLAYIDSGGNLAIYTPKLNTITPLTDFKSGTFSQPSWANDNVTLASVHRTDSASKIYTINIQTQTCRLIHSCASLPCDALISPDGTRTAVITGINLDLLTIIPERSDPEKQSFVIPESYRRQSLAWSPSGDTLSYISDTPDLSDLILINIHTGNTRQIFHGNIGGHTWSPSGRFIAINDQDGSTGSASIGIIDLDSSQKRPVEKTHPGKIDNMKWTSDGLISCRSGDQIYRIQPEGTFIFDNIFLTDGKNRFHVTATDQSGNTGEASDDILLTHNRPENITIEVKTGAPSYQPSSDILIHVGIQDNTAPRELQVRVSIIDENGQSAAMLADQKITSSEHARSDLRFVWRAPGASPGTYTAIVEILENRLPVTSAKTDFDIQLEPQVNTDLISHPPADAGSSGGCFIDLLF